MFSGCLPFTMQVSQDTACFHSRNSRSLDVFWVSEQPQIITCPSPLRMELDSSHSHSQPLTRIASRNLKASLRSSLVPSNEIKQRRRSHLLNTSNSRSSLLQRWALGLGLGLVGSCSLDLGPPPYALIKHFIEVLLSQHLSSCLSVLSHRPGSKDRCLL